MGNLTMHVYSLYVTNSYTIYLALIYVYSTVPQHLQILATPLHVSQRYYYALLVSLTP